MCVCIKYYLRTGVGKTACEPKSCFTYSLCAMIGFYIIKGLLKKNKTDRGMCDRLTATCKAENLRSGSLPVKFADP